MKSAEQIKTVLVKLESDLKAIRERIDEIRVWCNAGNTMQNKEFFIKQMEYLEDLQKQEWQADYRLRAYRWVLDTDNDK